MRATSVRLACLSAAVLLVGLQPAMAFAPTTQEQVQIEPNAITSLYGHLTPPSRDAPDTIARSFIAAHAVELGLLDVAQLEKTSMQTSLLGTHHRFGQFVDGVPVVGAEVSIHVLKDGTVLAAHANVIQRVAPSGPTAIPALVAERLANARVPGELIGSREVVIADGAAGVPAWQIWIRPTANPYTIWTVSVASATGAVIEAFDNADYATASGTVWTDPIRASGDADLRGDEAGSDAALDLSSYRWPVTVDNLAEPGILSGPWVRIMEAARGGSDFDVDRLDPRFEEFMSYYWIDTTQKYIQSLGFVDETGVAGYAIDVYPHAQVSIHNAFYLHVSGSPIYGTGAGMIAFGWRAPCAAPDPAGATGCDSSKVGPGTYAPDDVGESADVILHEYGHAMQDSIVPNFRGNEGLGEGWGDYWALTQIARLNNTTYDACLGTWFGAHIWPQQDGETHCIRNLVNNLTMKDIKGKGIHFAGQLISGAMWEIRAAIGNETADRLFIEATFLMPASGGVKNMAEAIILTDLEMHAGAHSFVALDTFTARDVDAKLDADILHQVEAARLLASPPAVVPAASEPAPGAPFVLVIAALGLLAVRRRRSI